MRVVAIAAAAICFIVAVLYWIGVPPLGHHLKHGIAFAALGVLALVWLRFLSAGASSASA